MSASSSSEQPQNTAQNVKSDAAPAVAPTATSCRKKKSDSQSTTFFGDIVEHIDEFVHASYDEHKSCLTKTLNKMFGMSKAVANSAGGGSTPSTSPVENVMPRPATTE